MWEWLQGLSGGAATFVGSLTGSLVGLLAILAGAMFNAHLNRRRDDRLRKEETRAVAVAVQSELTGFHRTLTANARELRDVKADFVVPELGRSIRVMPELLSKLGYLNADTIRFVIDAYLVIEQYGGHLILRGGKRGNREHGQDRLIALPKEKAALVVSLNEVAAAEIEKAIKALNTYLY
jgi:hypothetical protein